MPKYISSFNNIEHFFFTFPDETEEEVEEPKKPEETTVGKSPYFETELRTETTWEEEEEEEETTTITVKRLVVRVKGVPKPTVSWYEDGREIVPGPEYEVEEPDDDGVSTLTIHKRPVEENAREITCRAVNEHGTATTSTLVIPGTERVGVSTIMTVFVSAAEFSRLLVKSVPASTAIPRDYT